jgi:hypothetical protein
MQARPVWQLDGTSSGSQAPFSAVGARGGKHALTVTPLIDWLWHSS